MLICIKRIKIVANSIHQLSIATHNDDESNKNINKPSVNYMSKRFRIDKDYLESDKYTFTVSTSLIHQQRIKDYYIINLKRYEYTINIFV